MGNFIDIGVIFAEAVAYYILLDGFMSEKDFSAKYSFIKYLIFITALFISGKFSFGLIGTFATFMLISFLCSYFYDGNIKKRLLISGLFFGISAAIEYLCGAVIMWVFSINSVEFSTYTQYYLIGCIVSKIITLLMVKLLCLMFCDRQTAYMSYWAFLMPIPVINIILLFSMIYFFDDTTSNSIFPLSLAMGGILYSDVFVFYIYDKLIDMFELRLKNNLLTYQIDSQNKSIKDNAENEAKIRSIHHDGKNHIIVLRSLMADKHYTEALNYLKELDETGLIENAVNSGCLPLDAIINAKVGMAESLDIEVKYNIKPIPSDLKLSGMEICMLFGNLFDNAIESCVKCDKNKHIDFGLSYSYERLYIKINNSIRKDIKLTDGMLTTDKTDKFNHGIGLKNIRKVVEDHNGIMNISCQDNIFSVKICIFDI